MERINKWALKYDVKLEALNPRRSAVSRSFFAAKYLLIAWLMVVCFYFIYESSYDFFKRNVGTEIGLADSYQHPLPAIAFCRYEHQGKYDNFYSCIYN